MSAQGLSDARSGSLAGGTPGQTGQGGPLAGLGAALARAELGALFTLAAAAALGVGLILWALRPDWVPVSERGGREAALALVETLGSAGIEHRMDPSTGLVLVPRDRLGEVRAHVAAAGLDADPGIGLEMLSDEPALGTSQFTETRRYQHALEIELARTISGMRGVETARVHLALPNRSVFVRDREAASASVMVQGETGRELDDEQVDAIRRLVAAGIPYLDADGVTVVDRWGRLLSGGDDARGAGRERYAEARRIERLYAERIETLLTPLVGRGRVHATVTADVDFSQEEMTAELFDAEPAKLRSEQTDTASGTGTVGVGGVPGSLVNQPPEGGVAVDPTVAGAAEGAAIVPTNESASAVRNYELDRTIRHVRRTPGQILRVSAAVVVDDRTSVNDAGETVRVPLTDEELAQFEALAREAIGFDAGRGDSVTVANRGFLAELPLEPLAELPLWEQPWLAPLLREGAIGLAVLLLVWVGVRPALGRVLNSGARRALPAPGARADDDDVRVSLGASNPDERADASGRDGAKQAIAAPERPVVYGDILATARAMAADDPKRVAQLVKNWVGEPR